MATSRQMKLLTEARLAVQEVTRRRQDISIRAGDIFLCQLSAQLLPIVLDLLAHGDDDEPSLEGDQTTPTTPDDDQTMPDGETNTTPEGAPNQHETASINQSEQQHILDTKNSLDFSVGSVCPLMQPNSFLGAVTFEEDNDDSPQPLPPAPECSADLTSLYTQLPLQSLAQSITTLPHQEGQTSHFSQLPYMRRQISERAQ